MMEKKTPFLIIVSTLVILMGRVMITISFSYRFFKEKNVEKIYYEIVMFDMNLFLPLL